MSHQHNFKSWAFEEPINTVSFTTRQVLEGVSPVLEVYHDHDGDWQFLCGGTPETSDLKLVCLGCMVERDPTLLQLADMPPGWSATRATPTEGWSREQFEDSDDDEA